MLCVHVYLTNTVQYIKIHIYTNADKFVISIDSQSSTEVVLLILKKTK